MFVCVVFGVLAFIGSIILSVGVIISANFKHEIAYADEYVYLSGEVSGFSIVSEGVTVIGLCDVITKEKTYSPAKDAGIKVGDLIVKINNNIVNSDTVIDDLIQKSIITVEIKREDSYLTFTFSPAQDVSGKYKLGVFVRNDITGIGTITFFKDSGEFSSLGHEVYSDNLQKIKVIGGNVYKCGISKIVKGIKGDPGEIQGYLKKGEKVGNILYGKNSGIYGKSEDLDLKCYQKTEILKSNDVSIGNANIYTNISGYFKYYDISIIKVDQKDNDKNFVVRITDEELLNLTGGIIQGMSGTPILQNGKIIGAITHVFVNDPKMGYGISIDNLLKDINN